MLNAIPGRRAQVLTAALILSVLLIAANADAARRIKDDSSTTTSASSTTTSASLATEPSYPWKLITADSGGTIDVAEGVTFKVRARTLQEDTVIWAGMEQTADGISFIFGPSGTQFLRDLKEKPAQLSVAKEILDDSPGCIEGKVIAALSADLASLEAYSDALGLGTVTGSLRELITELQNARSLKDFISILGSRDTGDFILYIQCIILDLQDAGGPDSAIADLADLIEDICQDLIGDLTICSEQYGEYIAEYNVAKNTIIWEIPHFSLYYYRRR